MKRRKRDRAKRAEGSGSSVVGPSARKAARIGLDSKSVRDSGSAELSKVEQTPCACSRHAQSTPRPASTVRVSFAQAAVELSEKWRKDYLRDAAKGDLTATGVLGQMYLTGFGGSQCLPTALEFFNEAADRGHITSEDILTQLVDAGIYLEDDSVGNRERVLNFKLKGNSITNGTLLPRLQEPESE